MWAWVLTIPISGAVSYLIFLLIHRFFPAA
jgi:phosphate/sulfate permease